MARPFKPPEDRKTKRLTLYFTPAEEERLANLAAMLRTDKTKVVLQALEQFVAGLEDQPKPRKGKIIEKEGKLKTQAVYEKRKDAAFAGHEKSLGSYRKAAQVFVQHTKEILRLARSHRAGSGWKVLAEVDSEFSWKGAGVVTAGTTSQLALQGGYALFVPCSRYCFTGDILDRVDEWLERQYGS